ncbi:MAG: LD-carboxypeptidase [Cyanobacteria bacterium J06632_22]
MTARCHFSRRHFLGAAVVGGFAVAAPTAGDDAVAQTLSAVKPRRLKPGDTVGIISPAGATFVQEQLDIVVDAVRGLGLVPKLAPHVLDRHGYLAGRDEDRAADVNAFFADPTVMALLPIRGDVGSARILPYLDYDLIREHPKIITGFSDLTALLLGIHAQTGLVTFHGPNGLTAWRDNQIRPFRQVLFEGTRFRFENEIAGEDRDRIMQTRNRILTLTPGRARGRLYGGNLSVLSGIVGSPYLPDMTGAILFVEDIGESIYRIDRMLTQLKLAGILDQLSGFIFGQCTNCGPGADYGSLTLPEVLQDLIRPLGIPAWSGAMLGHVEPIVTLPLGVEVDIDAETGVIQMLSAAVV